MAATALSVVIALTLLSRPAEAFVSPASSALAGGALRRVGGGGAPGAARKKYIPDGVNPEEWEKIKAKEEAAKKGGNLGRLGVQGFKSRSLQAWQEAGASHLFPVDPQKVETGEVPQEKMPYMQRGGGAWDDSDLAKKNVVSQSGKKITTKPWSNKDKEYAEGGYAKELSASLFPKDPMHWTPGKPPGDPANNKQSIEAQKNLGARPHTKASMSPQKSPLEKDAATKKQNDAKLKKQLKSDGTRSGKNGGRGLFGLW